MPGSYKIFNNSPAALDPLAYSLPGQSFTPETKTVTIAPPHTNCCTCFIMKLRTLHMCIYSVHEETKTFFLASPDPVCDHMHTVGTAAIVIIRIPCSAIVFLYYMYDISGGRKLIEYHGQIKKKIK